MPALSIIENRFYLFIDIWLKEIHVVEDYYIAVEVNNVQERDRKDA